MAKVLVEMFIVPWSSTTKDRAWFLLWEWPLQTCELAQAKITLVRPSWLQTLSRRTLGRQTLSRQTLRR